jgi:anti-sigma regulatory factor (Ser/Thr protein kinase)
MTEPSSETFPGTLVGVERLREHVRERAKQGGLPAKAVYNLCLAIDEIATNVVLYGYEKAGRTGSLRIGTSLDEETFTVTLDDEGVAFDPSRFVPPTPEEFAQRLEDRTIGGLGLFLAFRSVDTLRYDVRSGVNRHTFSVKRQPHGSTPLA